MTIFISTPTCRAWFDNIAECAIALGSKWLCTRQAALYLNLSYRTLEKLRFTRSDPASEKFRESQESPHA